MSATGQPLLSLHDVSVQFGGLRALSNVSFDLRGDEITALIGPNGAGKTTLLNVICGALRPTAGTVVYKSQRISGRPAHAVNAAGIARTFQSVELFTQLSVRENVMTGGVAGQRLNLAMCMAALPRARQAQRELESHAEELLAFVGLNDLADEPAGGLPAGRRRLLGIARALATRPDVLILDEPGAGLIEAEKLELSLVMRRITELGTTLLFVEHDMELVGRLAQRLIVLDQGAVIADGPAATVKTDQRVINAYLGDPDAPPLARGTRRHHSSETALSVDRLTVGFGGLRALDDVSVTVGRGELVAILGPNGAGKSTLLNTIARLVEPESGTATFGGENLLAMSTVEVVSRGVSLAPEGRELFTSLTVRENLMLGQYAHCRQASPWRMMRNDPVPQMTQERLARVYKLFPVLEARRNQKAGTLSGGQAQMLAIGRALMSAPKLLMLDEPSLGIAPQLVRDILDTLIELRNEGLTILLVEQNARAALQIADRGYLLSSGRIIASGDASDLADEGNIAASYLSWQGEAAESPQAGPAHPIEQVEDAADQRLGLKPNV